MSATQRIVEDESYEDFITNEDEVFQFETDMEEMKYQQWIEKYPEHVLSIFGALMSFSGDQMTEQDVLYFKNKGIDLNAPSNVYRSDTDGTTPLGCASEFRLNELMQSLINQGVNVNQEDQHGFTPIESVLMGHGYNDRYKIKDVETCVKILVKANIKNELQGHIIPDFCEEYQQSEYLKNFLNQSKIRVPLTPHEP